MSTTDPTDGMTDAEREEFDRQEAAEQGERDQASANVVLADERDPDDSWTPEADDHQSGRLDEQASAAFGDDLPPSMAPRSADEAALRDVFPIDVKGHAAYPVEQARAYAADALVPTKTYDTPWGARAMGDVEVADLRAQGLTIEPVDSAPTASLEQDKDEMRGIPFGTRDN